MHNIVQHGSYSVGHHAPPKTWGILPLVPGPGAIHQIYSPDDPLSDSEGCHH